MISLKHLHKNTTKMIDYFYDARWDRKLGIYTSGLKEVHELSVGASQSSFCLQHARRFQPSPYRLLWRSLSVLPDSVKDYRFIDYGCGNARAMIFALELGFSDALGVDFDTELCEWAERNLSQYKKNHSNRIMTTQILPIDVLDLSYEKSRFGSRPCVHFFYNPFDSYVLYPLIKKMKQAGRFERGDIVIYINPVRSYLFELFGLEYWHLFESTDSDRKIAILRPPLTQTFRNGAMKVDNIQNIQP